MAVDHMSRTNPSRAGAGGLVIPALGGLWAALTVPADVILRIVTGIALVAHGWGKVINPFGAVDMVERIGFVPGMLWSPLLSFSEFGTGVLLILGFLTRPAAIVALIILLVTIYFHWIILGQGYMGSEKSILWSAMLLAIIARGGGALSVDRAIGRQV
ncbi:MULTISPECIES: DoxX family protein [unclassified Chelatococcus]|jgi:putative oxidoreductase|uniref:DoxX family protein n=2 Tax=Chelatococcus TaxID=28209 RepID=UPI0020C14EB6|nr:MULTISPECIES: DoxX family protein [unclassified Chelatococcus]MCO5078101.1 DoxX family protein [Chelatococcus sp.]CAH1661581.1 putative oxidoreductase [Hyphomicrobiales bacterium]CAH1683052.1 putative oxidoreductase [Hyphomicrobiales bacterium]